MNVSISQHDSLSQHPYSVFDLIVFVNRDVSSDSIFEDGLFQNVLHMKTADGDDDDDAKNRHRAQLLRHLMTFVS